MIAATALRSNIARASVNFASHLGEAREKYQRRYSHVIQPSTQEYMSQELTLLQQVQVIHKEREVSHQNIEKGL